MKVSREGRGRALGIKTPQCTERGEKYIPVTGLDGTLRITQIPCDICALDVAAHGGLPVSRKRRNAKYDRPNSNQCVLLSGYSIRLIDAVQNHQKKYALVSLVASPAH